jgi:hypothetical protein
MNFFILVIMATTWNLLAGYAGMVSIGQQGFVGRGAYATLYFAIKGVNPFVAIPLAILACGAIALPVTFLIGGHVGHRGQRHANHRIDRAAGWWHGALPARSHQPELQPAQSLHLPRYAGGRPYWS